MNIINIKGIDRLQFPEEISSETAGLLDLFSKYDENQLFHIYEPDLGVFIAETPMVIERALNAGYQPLAILTEERYISDCSGLLDRCGDIPVFMSDHFGVGEITGYNLPRSIVCAFRRKDQPAMSDFLIGKKKIAIMDDVTNPTNVGAIMRSAAALGVDGVVLTSSCGDPLYRRAARVSVGTVFQVPWMVIKNNIWYKDGMETLKQAGFKTVAMALVDKSVSIDDEKLRSEDRLAILLGNEGYGLKSETIEACDYKVKIPMTEGVDSLNVAAASAVVFWELCRKK